MTKHNTAIEWTHIPGFRGETWNPIVGCSIVSKGCTNCYAMRVAAQRLDGNPKTPHYGGTTTRVNNNPVWTGKVERAPEKTWLKPFSWRDPRSVFVNSMGDLFHEDVPDDWISQTFAVMACNPRHIFIILTKRPLRMRDYCQELQSKLYHCQSNAPHPTGAKPLYEMFDFGIMPSVLPNVWLGVSVEDQQSADERIPLLLDTPAAVRFASCEPLLGPLDIEEHLQRPDAVGKYVLPGLNWVIAGGESGPDARPMHPDWVRSLRDQCASAAGVPFFFKQWGEWAPGSHLQHLGDEIDGCQYGSFDPEHDWQRGKESDCTLFRIGKVRAGHLLDGTAHHAWPECVREMV